MNNENLHATFVESSTSKLYRSFGQEIWKSQ
jgi:hypothetical protein